MKNLFFFLSILFITSASAQQPSACGTLLEDISAGTIEELGAEYRRLKSYSNPYCDTTDSDFNKIMNELAKKLVASKSSSEAIIAQLETPYF